MMASILTASCCTEFHTVDQGLSSYRDKMLIDDVDIPSNARNLS